MSIKTFHRRKYLAAYVSLGVLSSLALVPVSVIGALVVARPANEKKGSQVQTRDLNAEDSAFRGAGAAINILPNKERAQSAGNAGDGGLVVGSSAEVTDKVVSAGGSVSNIKQLIDPTRPPQLRVGGHSSRLYSLATSPFSISYVSTNGIPTREDLMEAAASTCKFLKSAISEILDANSSRATDRLECIPLAAREAPIEITYKMIVNVANPGMTTSSENLDAIIETILSHLNMGGELQLSSSLP